MQEIKARLEIESILFHYTSSIDSGDLESTAKIFTKGAIHSSGNIYQGYSEVFNTYKSAIIFYDDEDNEVEYNRLKCSPKTKHLNTNIQYSFNADITSANVSSYFTVYQTIKSNSQIVVGGRYEDEFLLEGNWYLKLRKIYIENLGDMTFHIRSDVINL